MKRSHLSRRKVSLQIIAVLLVMALTPYTAQAQARGTDFTPSAGITPYGRTFYNNCENEQWFINEVERLLNVQKRSINTLRSINDLDEVYTISLVNRNITGKIPKAAGSLRNLRHLFLSGNNLSNYSANTAFPTELYSLGNLETIDVSHNNFSCPIPTALGSLQKLKILMLWDNDFIGTIPDSLGQLTKLENLDLSYNRLTGGIPEELGNLRKLLLFSASNNELAGSVPVELSNCQALKSLVLWNNHLSGTIPPSFSGLSKLMILDLAQNSITGNLPPTLANTLRELSVGENQMTGEVPVFYSYLTSLEVFDLHNNGFSGKLPDFSGMAKMLVYDVSNNGFMGVIPNDMFSHMTKLKIAWFNNNKLVGFAPGSLLEHQTKGADVDFSHNYMTGAALRQIVKNEDNFTDGAYTFQNRMYMEETNIEIEIGEEINVYALFDTRDAADMSVITPKPKLRPIDYTITLGPNMTAARVESLLSFLGAESLNEVYSIRYTSEGIYLKALKPIPEEMAVEFALKIKHNTGSAYSRTLFNVTTPEYDVPTFVGHLSRNGAALPMIEAGAETTYKFSVSSADGKAFTGMTVKLNWDAVFGYVSCSPMADVSVSYDPVTGYFTITPNDPAGIAMNGSVVDVFSFTLKFVETQKTKPNAELKTFRITVADMAAKFGIGNGFDRDAGVEFADALAICPASTIIDVPNVDMKYDVNGDGKVNAADVTLVTQNVGKKANTNATTQKCDLNGDKVVDAQDVALIQAYIKSIT